MSPQSPITVLLAPLDWGLGHATRCIPIITELKKQGFKVILAANGAQKRLLQLEFGNIECLEIPAYAINLKRGFLLKWSLLFRFPFIIRQIKKENRWLHNLRKQRVIHAVISDNRYGLYHKEIPSVFLTHQLGVQSGLGKSAIPGERIRAWHKLITKQIDQVLLKLHYRMIRRFTCCWIPDTKDVPGVAGELSHPSLPSPIPVTYLGILSRFSPSQMPVRGNSLLALVSGPEPQRTDFENLLVGQFVNLDMKIVLVRGLPDQQTGGLPSHKNLEVFNHLPLDQLGQLIAASEFIISRSGYSTIMDLLAMNKTAILVPTPGQTEQEYLGARLHEMKWMYTVNESRLNLQRDLNSFRQSKLVRPAISASCLEKAVSELAEILTVMSGK